MPFNQLVSLNAFPWKLRKLRKLRKLMYDGGGWCFLPNLRATGAGLYAAGSSSNGGEFCNHQVDQAIAATHEAGTPARVIVRMDHYQEIVVKMLPAFFLPVSGTSVTWVHVQAGSTVLSSRSGSTISGARHRSKRTGSVSGQETPAGRFGVYEGLTEA